MADNKNIQDGRDRSKVNGHESFKAAGNNREDVEAWLQQHRKH